jgi:urease accessory protein
VIGAHRHDLSAFAPGPTDAPPFAYELPGPEFARFRDEPPQMRSGAVGKRGWLSLAFEKRRDLTVLADLVRRTPCLVSRALYCDAALPDMPWLFTITSTGCVLQGDRLHMDVSLKAGARAHVTTQSATKIHAMDANYGVMTQSLMLDEDAYLEFLPDPLLLHRGARFASRTRIRIAPSATLLYSEIVQPGRKHHQNGESLAVTLLSLELSAERPDGKLLMRERLVLDPQETAPRQTGVMDSFDVFANVLLLTPRAKAESVAARLSAGVDHERGLAHGACSLPNDGGLIYKVLGRETATVKEAVRGFWAVAREECAGAEIPAPFIWR